ncbi:hypothetical protein BGX34_004094 [Mortierella sp. NVP85]|nr:hypothetical protein BGX34_004094 [Mortierella sp. NVP85]
MKVTPIFLTLSAVIAVAQAAAVLVPGRLGAAADYLPTSLGPSIDKTTIFKRPADDECKHYITSFIEIKNNGRGKRDGKDGENTVPTGEEYEELASKLRDYADCVSNIPHATGEVKATGKEELIEAVNETVGKAMDYLKHKVLEHEPLKHLKPTS